MDVLVLRDPRESTRKCSLSPLRGMPGIRFASYRPDARIEVGGRILLHPEGPELSTADAGPGLLLLDCAWRRVGALMAVLDGEPTRRSLPPLVTAYPRRSKTFVDPERGLASVEALFAALAILGSPRPELLSAYPWAGDFLRLNPDLPS